MNRKILYCFMLLLPLAVPHVSGEESETKKLSEILKNGSTEERREAAISLGNTGDPLAVPPLIEALRQPKYISGKATESLVRIGGPAVEPLIAALQEAEDDRDMQKRVLRVLVKIGDRRAAEPLLHIIAAGNHRTVRKIAIEGLQKMHWYPSGTEETIIYAIATEDWNRCVQIGEPAVQPLIASFKDPERTGNKTALVQIGEPAVQQLIAALRDENGYIRLGAVITLGKMADERALEALIPLIDDKNECIRDETLKTLETLGTKGNRKVIELFVGTLKNRDIRLNGLVKASLSRIGEPAVGPLITAAGNTDRHYRKEAVETLGMIRSATAVETLIDALKDWHVSSEAMRSLTNIGGPAVEPLISALGDENWRVRAYSAEALGRIRDSKAAQPLLELNDTEEHWKVKSCVKSALCGLKVYNSLKEAEEASKRGADKKEIKFTIEPDYYGRHFWSDRLGDAGSVTVSDARTEYVTQRTVTDKSRGFEWYMKYSSKGHLLYKKKSRIGGGTVYYTDYKRDSDGKIQEKTIYESQSERTYLKTRYVKGVKAEEKMVTFTPDYIWVIEYR